MQQHTLKTDPSVFTDVKDGIKTFEIRKNDRNYQVGDILILTQTLHTGEQMAEGKSLCYTGNVIAVKVLHILTGPIYGLQEGWVIMSIEIL